MVLLTQPIALVVNGHALKLVMDVLDVKSPRLAPAGVVTEFDFRLIWSHTPAAT